jgi:hypothetical protein
MNSINSYQTVKPVSRLQGLLAIFVVALSSISTTGCSETKAREEALAADASHAQAQAILAEALQSELSDALAIEIAGQADLAQTQAQFQEPDEAETDSPEPDGVLGKAKTLFEAAKSQSGSTASGAGKWVQYTLNGATKSGGQTADDTMNWANETFQSLKSQGLTTANDTSEWLGQDFNNMESWEYKIVTSTGNDDEVSELLNQLGTQGWECFSTEHLAPGTRLFMKKPTHSYLRQLPFKDLIKLVPLMGGNNN